MEFRQGEMFDFSKEQPDVLLFTGNSTINKKGELVMGRGAALQAKKKWPELGVNLAKLVSMNAAYNGSDGRDYGLVIDHTYNPAIGVFQVKHFWGSDAGIDIIKFSTTILNRHATTSLKTKSIWMNFPGIGYGRLHRDIVIPVISVLPDNVTVWEFPER